MRDLIRPVVVAPMAGGPTTPELVEAAAGAGATAFLAAGYRTPAAVEAEVRRLQATTRPYGLNIFVPMPPPPDVPAIERYRRLLQPEAERYGVDLPPVRVHDDDAFGAKVALAEAYAVPLVSFTFGVPARPVVDALRARGSAVLITVTSAAEAVRAVAAGPDALIAQAGTAGGHAATTGPSGYRGVTTAPEVLAAVRAVTELPVIVAGGVTTGDGVAALLRRGAIGVQCGTAFLLADEAGTRPAHRRALLSGEFTETVVTRAFSGQPARGLRNRFIDAYDAVAPVGYPAVHHLTAPIRASAARQDDAGALNLWAGTGFAAARSGPAADLVAALTLGFPDDVS